MAKNKTAFVSVNSLSTPDRQQLKSAIMEMNDSMTRVSAENDFQRDVINTISEELGIDKKLVKRMARTYYKSSFNIDVEAQKNFEEFYSVLLSTQQEQTIDYGNGTEEQF